MLLNRTARLLTSVPIEEMYKAIRFEDSEVLARFNAA